MNLTYPREWLKIANRALNLIGAEPIQEFDSAGEAAQNLNIQLPAAVQEVLAYHPYRCARSRSTLAPLVDSPAFGYKYAYQLPSDFCSLIEAWSGGVKLDKTAYSMEGGQILSDEEELGIVYTALPPTPESLTPAVQQAIEYLLAYKMAEITTASDNLTMRLYQEYQTALVESVKRDNQGSGDTAGEKWWSEER